jgi:two-component system cell cycle sensor histidine kinase/response regulator CckA
MFRAGPRGARAWLPARLLSGLRGVPYHPRQMRIPETSVAFSRPLRAIALLVGASSLVWELAARENGPAPTAVWVARITEIVLCLAVAAASSPRLSLALLRGLAFMLAIAVSLTNVVIAAFVPARVWETMAVHSSVVFGAALFAPWSWRWQAALAGAVTTMALAALFAVIERSTAPPGTAEIATVFLLSCGAASVLGTHLADRERQRVALSEARYRELFQQAGDGIAVLAATGAIHEANPRLGELLGRPLDHIIGHHLGEFLAPAEQTPGGAGARVTAEQQAALRGALRTTLHTLMHSDGRPVEVEIAYARTETRAGPIVQAIVRDLTERRAVERQHAQAQKLDSLGRFAGGIVHQFNNLLGGILTHTGVLRADAANQAAARELDEILEATRRGRELTRELLRFTRSTPLALRPVSATELIASARTLTRAALPDEVTVETVVAPGCPALTADPDRLAEALLQLAFNAREALRGPGHVRIEAAPETVAPDDARWPGARPGGYVRLSVSDTGSGMDAATVERVLEPFFSTKPLHQATGLGLSTVHGIVRDHGGALRINSARGRGTTVHLLIPAAAASPTAVPAAPARQRARGGGATVLIVDDEEIVRSSLRRALTRFGYRVLEAADGATALAALQSAKPPVDLVVLDLVLPGGGAGIFELLKAVRPELKFLVSSGYTPDDEAALGLVPQVEGFLQKPYELPELRAAVAKALGRG